MNRIDKTHIKTLVNSQKYSLVMFSICVLYTLTALPRLDISDILKNVIIFGSIPCVILNSGNYQKRVIVLFFISIVLQLTSWVNAQIFFEEYSKSSPNIKPLTALFMFVFISLWVKGNKNRRIIIFSSLVFSFILTVLYDLIAHDTISKILAGFRVDFDMHNAQFASMLSFVSGILTIYISRALVCNHQELKVKIYTLTSIILTLIAISLISSQSRQVFLAIVIVSAILPLIIFNSKTKISIIYIFFILAFLMLSQLDAVNSRILKESYVFTLILNGDFSGIPMTDIGVRINSWIVAWEWIKHSPILGADFESISHVTRTSELFLSQGLTGYGHLHNTFIEILVAYGIVGLIFILFFYQEIVRNVAKTLGRDEWILLITFLLFWAVINMFESYNHKGLGLYAHTIVLGGLYTLQRKKET